MNIVHRVQLSQLFLTWVPSYIFTHIGLLMIALWVASQPTGFEPIIAYIVAVAISMLNDVIMLGLYFSDAQDATDGKYIQRLCVYLIELFLLSFVCLVREWSEEVGHASSVYDVKLHSQALFYMLRLV